MPEPPGTPGIEVQAHDVPIRAQDPIDFPQHGVGTGRHFKRVGQQDRVDGIRRDSEVIQPGERGDARRRAVGQHGLAPCSREGRIAVRAPASDLQQLVPENALERAAERLRLGPQQALAKRADQPLSGCFLLGYRCVLHFHHRQ